MSATVDRPQTVPSKSNPNLEVHYYCPACHPNAERALCGERLYGINLAGSAMTCMVCADFGPRRCPECGKRP